MSTEQRKVLLVDDNTTLLKLGRAIFESGGYEVITAADGVEALSILSEHAVELVVTDILMPNMDGYSLCYWIRSNERYNKVPVIVYSATYISKSDENLALEIGADMFIRKPASMKFLLEAAQDLISKKRQDNHKANIRHDLSDVTLLYNAKLIEKLEQKNVELERVQGELVKSGKHFQALVENAVDIISLTDVNGIITYVSPALEKVTGFTPEEMIGTSFFSIMHPEYGEKWKWIFKGLSANPGVSIPSTNRFRHKNGSYVWVEGTVINLVNDENVCSIVANHRDITERKLAEQRLVNASRLYAFISGINQAIVHAADEGTVFREACRVATEVGKFKMAWIGMIDSTAEKISMVESSGMIPEDVRLFKNVHYDNNGPLAAVINTGSYYVCNDIENELELDGWRQYAHQRTLRSFMVLPLKRDGIIVGTINLYSSELDLFDAREILLLEEVAGDISFALDVFEKEKHRKQMADKVTHSELQLKQAQSTAHFGSWHLAWSAGVATWSDEACRIYGFDPTDNLHPFETWLSFIHPEDIEQVLKEIEKGQDSLSNSAFYHRIILRNGDIKHIYSQTEFELNAEGTVIGIHGVVHDITGIKMAEKGLSQSEANLRLIIDIIPQSIFVKDYQGKFIFINKSFAALYGLSVEDMVEKSLNEIAPSSNEAMHFLKEDQEVILSGKTKTIPEHSFTDFKGNGRIFHTIKVPFTVVGTNEKAVLGITMDITKEKNDDTERSKMLNDIVQRNKDLEQFSYIISHNLRAPVANISGIAEILQLDGLDRSEEKTFIRELSISVQKLDDVIMDLNYILQIKHTENKKVESIVFSELLNDIQLSIDNLIRNSKVEITTDFSAVDEIFSIKSYLYSIFLNLVSNSIKYKQDHTNPIIKIRSYLLNDKIQITYKDNGMGIDMEKSGKQVFGLYKRFHSHVEGKGIGLFMVKTQVESLGGKIAISSEVNKGTEFTIDFKIS